MTAQILETLRPRRSAMIIVLPSLSLRIFLLLYICVSNALMKFIVNTIINFFSMFCTLCSKFLWSAKTRYENFIVMNLNKKLFYKYFQNCRSNDKSAISICFSTECASYNGNHPIRYCEQCHNNRHNSRRGGDHIVHKAIPPIWEMEPDMQTCMVEAIVR